MYNKKKHGKQNVFIILLAAILILSLAACGESSEVTYTSTQNGVEMSITYYADGDKVTKQTAKNKIPYSSVGAKNESEAKKVIDPMAQQYKGIDGLEETLKYEDSFVTETVTIDYEAVDVSKLKGLPGTMFSGDTSKGISLKKTTEMLEKSGFKKSEE